MLRLAFDFIITWRETRTRPNAYFVFSVIPDKDEESVGIKTIAFRFFTLFRTTVLFQKGRFLQKYRSTSE